MLRFSKAWFGALLLAAVAFSAWGQPGTVEAQPAPAAPTPPANESDKRLKSRTIRVGLPAPLGARAMLRGDAADPQGFLREIMDLIAEAEGLKVEYVPLDRDAGTNHRDELAQGRIDVLAGATVGDTNLRSFRLSTPVIVTPGVAVTRKGGSRPSTVDELRKLKVVVPFGGAGRTFAAEQDIPVVPKNLYSDGFLAVINGEADAYLTTQLAGAFEIERSGYSTLQTTLLEPVGFRRAYAYAVRTEDSALVLAIEAGILKIERNGAFRRVYDRELARYQPLEAPSTIPITTVLNFGTATAITLLTAAALWQWRTHRRVAGLARTIAESELRYRGIFENSQDAVMLVDPKSRKIIEANPAAERMYGYGPGEMSGVSGLDLVLDPQAASERVERVVQEGTLRVTRSRHRRRDGRPIVTDVQASTGEIGGRTVIICILRDVSTAFARESLLHAVIDLSPHVAIQGFDAQGRVTFWNSASERLYGWTSAEAMGRGMGELIADPQSEAQMIALFAQLEQERRPSGVMEYTVHNRRGETKHVLSEIVPTTDADGRTQFICVDIDVTENRQRAADTERLRDELERARRLESLGLLAGGLAHDFNNLLVGIRGNSEIAQRSVEPGGPAHRALELVVQATDRTAELTQQLLAAAGHSRLEPEQLDLNAVAEESVALLRPRLGESVEVAFDLARPAVRTRADSAQTRQAVSNLLINAADAIERREQGRITVRTGTVTLKRSDFDDAGYKTRSTPGQYAFVEITDNGGGMDERTLARMFDPFYSTKATGRGLGLSLVMMTVRRHDGAIYVRSRPDEGTTCRLLLPLVSTDSVEPSTGGDGEPVKPGHALVIDDEPMVRSVIAAMLRAEGWRTHQASSGEDGLRAAANDQFDVVFVDLTMPGMSGVETARALRTVVPGIPIVYVSGYNREMAESAGPLDGEVFVQKPFDVRRLMEALAQAIHKRSRT